MKLPQYKIDEINRLLLGQYGRFESVRPLWRVVYSHDEFEKRFGTFTDKSKEGLFIREITEIREIPKYRQWADNLYVLERCFPIPEIHQREMQATFSYEPVWIFRDNKGNFLPPRWDACKLIIESVLEASAKAVGVKYKNPEYDKDTGLDYKKAQIDKVEEELFGNDTPLTTSLSHGSGITVPHNYNTVQKD